MIEKQNIAAEPVVDYYKNKSKTKYIEDLKKFTGTQDRIKCIEKLRSLLLKTDDQLDFFDWKLDFPEVMNKELKENAGFDIVIGNPPYGIIFDLLIKQCFEEKYDSFKRNNDIYVAFIERSNDLISKCGILTLITPNTYLNGDYFKSLRIYLKRNFSINEIIDFKNSKVFQDPTVFVCISIFKKAPTIKFPYEAVIKISNESFTLQEKKIIVIPEINDAAIKPDNKLIKQIFANKGRSSFSLLDEDYYVKDVGFNYWSIGKGKKRDGNSIGDRILYSGERLNVNDKSFLKGKDIEKYYISEPHNYLRHDFNLYLKPEVDIFRYSAEFLEISPKILYRQTSNKIIAALDFDKNLCDKTIHLIVPKTNNASVLFLIGLLNSSLFNYFYKDISQELEGRAFAQVKTTYIKKLPIIKIEKQKQIVIENIVSYIIFLKKHSENTSFLECLINAIVFELYLSDNILSTDFEILKHLLKIPQFNSVTNSVPELNIINTIINELSGKLHVVSVTMARLEDVEEIKIIEDRE